jgi:hypothetical protein
MKRLADYSVIIAIACALFTLCTWQSYPIEASPVTMLREMAIPFTVQQVQIADEDLYTADIAAETSGMGNVAKAEWCINYTQKAANRQSSLARLYMAGSVGYLGYDITIDASTIADMKAEVNGLATRIVTCQEFIDGVTD